MKRELIIFSHIKKTFSFSFFVFVLCSFIEGNNFFELMCYENRNLVCLQIDKPIHKRKSNNNNNNSIAIVINKQINETHFITCRIAKMDLPNDKWKIQSQLSLFMTIYI